MPEDIEDELQARGDALSLRAARYIRIKRQTERWLRESLRRWGESAAEHKPSVQSSQPSGKHTE